MKRWDWGAESTTQRSCDSVWRLRNSTAELESVSDSSRSQARSNSALRFGHRCPRLFLSLSYALSLSLIAFHTFIQRHSHRRQTLSGEWKGMRWHTAIGHYIASLSKMIRPESSTAKTTAKLHNHCHWSQFRLTYRLQRARFVVINKHL